MAMAKKKYFKKRQGYFGTEKVPLKFTIDILNLMIAYTISDNPLITRGCLSNLNKLFKLLDLRLYEDDYYLEGRIHFITQALVAKLDLHMDNRNLIIDYCYSNKYREVIDEILYDIKQIDLKTPDIKYMTSMISDRLNYCFLYLYKDKLQDEFAKLETNDFIHLKDLKSSIMDVITKLIADVRKAESLENTNMDFSLEPEIFEAIVDKTVRELQNPSSNLKTGMQAYNEMLGGALESGRIYMHIGVSGGFKSGILLNLLYQMKLNNKNFRTKDPNKKPLILLYTQENTVEESVNRLFSLAVSKDRNDKMKNYTPREAMRLLREKGQLFVDMDNNINILIKYAKTKTKTTQDLYYVIDEIEDQGYEVICLIHDYIKRLKSTQGHTEVRHELGAIVDELKALAIEKNIPVITATQLNKEAARVIDEGIQCNKADLARLLGRQHVGESWAMIENADYVILINREVQKSTGQRFLTFKLVKGRGEDTDITYFNQPFDGDNTMRLVQDMGLAERVSVVSLASDIMPDFEAVNERKHAKKREEIEEGEESKVFDLASYFERKSA